MRDSINNLVVIPGSIANKIPKGWIGATAPEIRQVMNLNHKQEDA